MKTYNFPKIPPKLYMNYVGTTILTIVKLMYEPSQTLCWRMWNALRSLYAPAYKSDLFAGGADAVKQTKNIIIIWNGVNTLHPSFDYFVNKYSGYNIHFFLTEQILWPWKINEIMWIHNTVGAVYCNHNETLPFDNNNFMITVTYRGHKCLLL